MSINHPKFTDEVLTAYLDGELDAETHAQVDAALAQDDALVARLADLHIPKDILRQVMAPSVLQAPSMPALPAPAATRRRGSLVMPLALAASFAVGVVVTQLLQPEPPAPGGWINAVASYQALYVTETLSGTEQPVNAREEVLARATEVFGVMLGPALSVEGLEFKRAQMLGFKGKPLLQMAYLTQDGTPMALCMIPVSDPDRGLKPTSMSNLAGASWVRDGVGYFLIGGKDAKQITDLSETMMAVL